MRVFLERPFRELRPVKISRGLEPQPAMLMAFEQEMLDPGFPQQEKAPIRVPDELTSRDAHVV